MFILFTLTGLSNNLHFYCSVFLFLLHTALNRDNWIVLAKQTFVNIVDKLIEQSHNISPFCMWQFTISTLNINAASYIRHTLHLSQSIYRAWKRVDFCGLFWTTPLWCARKTLKSPHLFRSVELAMLFGYTFLLSFILTMNWAIEM